MAESSNNNSPNSNRQTSDPVLIPEVKDWSTERVADWLGGQNGLEKVGSNAKLLGVDGATMLKLDKEGWQELGVGSAVQRAKLLAAMQVVQQPELPVIATGGFLAEQRAELIKAGGRVPSTLESMGLACCTALVAVNFTHPIETVKTRMQVGSFNMSTFLKEEGVLALWKGIQPAWMREATYTTVKLGGYGPIRDALGAKDKNSPFMLKFLAGSLSGSIGSVVGNPFDVMKTLMMANAKEKTSFPKLAQRLLADQGVAGFYRGIEANILRACMLNGTKMSCYDQIKSVLCEKTGWKRNELRCQFGSAFGAGFFMTCTVAPFDNLRTRLMNQPTDKKLYNGFLDAATKILRTEGPGAFYRGFFPMWARFAPQATLQLVIFDNLLALGGFKGI
jgi:hypothetical protein